MVERVTRRNLDDNERKWYDLVTTARNKNIRRTEAQAIALIQELRERNEAHKAEFEALANSNGTKIAKEMYKVAGTLD